MPEKKQKILLLIDGNALLHRAFHALPEMLSPKGQMVNAVYGFSAMLFKVLREMDPEYIVATFDMAAPTFRHEEYKEYKAHRVKGPNELYTQLPLIKDILKSLNISIFERKGYEADDLIGTIAKMANKNKNVMTMIATGDLDTLQLINKNTKVYTLKKGIKDTITYDEKAVIDRYGIKPEQVVDFKGLKGDPSDNIPGVAGVGEKTASTLIKEYGSMENLYKKKNLEKLPEKLKQKLVDNKEMAFFSKKLATIKLNVPVEFSLKDSTWQDYDVSKTKKILEDLEFRSLISRLPNHVEESPSSADSGVPKEESKKSVLEEIEKLYKAKIFSEKIYKLEKSLVPAVEHMQDSGIKADGDILKNISVKITGTIDDLQAKIFKAAGTQFNISSPQQLSEVLFKTLEINATGLRKTPGGVISTSAPELVKIKDLHPIIPLIMEYRELMKLKTTYTDSLPKLIDPKTGRIHATFDQLGAATGRFSSINPNMQNIPVRTEIGKEIRGAFVAEKGCELISLDYSQIDLRVAASIAQDKKMIKAFNDGEDIHASTAAEINNVALDKVTSAMRRQAKVLNFGVLYGMSIHGFSESAGVPRDVAKAFIKEYMEDFVGISSYIKNIKEHAKQFEVVETIWGRRRPLPGINSGGWQVKQSAERMAINMPVQGTAADIIKKAMVDVYEKIIKGHEDEIRMILQVHDELLFEIKNDKVDEYIEPIKDIMENSIKLAVPLTVDLKVGDNWKDMK